MSNHYLLMPSHDRKSPALFICLFSFLSCSIYSQSSCNCPEYATLRSEYEISNSESKLYTQPPIASSNSICQAKGYEWIAADYSDNKIFDTAEIYFKKAGRLYRQSGCPDSVLLNTYKKWAELYYVKGDFAKAQDFSFKLLQSTESSRSAYEQAGVNTMIAQLLNQTGQAEKGIIYSRRAVAFFEQIDSPAHIADILFKLSKRYLWYLPTKNMSR